MRRTGVIADDFTGATDIAIAYVARGYRAVVVTGVPEEGGPDGASGPGAARSDDVDAVQPVGVDVVVVALKTRTAPVDVAVAQSLAALEHLRAAGCERFVFKYCSTFDSTDTGNIGPVLDALRRATGAQRVVVAPAFPDNGRTVYRGHLFVGDDLLEHSPMRRHPLTPMTRSRLVDVLRPQTTGTVAEVTLPVVRAGAQALRAAIDATAADAVVVDGIEDGDLAVLAAATADDVLVSGSAGVALGTAAADVDVTATFRAAEGPGVVLSGSASARTREQLAHAADVGMPIAVVDPDADEDAEVRRLAAWVASHDTSTVPVVTSLADPQDTTSDDPAVSARMERVLAGVAEQVVADGVRRVLVAGGETSGAVVGGLGVRALDIGPRIAPGVCWAAARTTDGTEVALALKSGNFGEPEMFETAWAVLS